MDEWMKVGWTTPPPEVRRARRAVARGRRGGDGGDGGDGFHVALDGGGVSSPQAPLLIRRQRIAASVRPRLPATARAALARVVSTAFPPHALLQLPRHSVRGILHALRAPPGIAPSPATFTRTPLPRGPSSFFAFEFFVFASSPV